MDLQIQVKVQSGDKATYHPVLVDVPDSEVRLGQEAVEDWIAEHVEMVLTDRDYGDAYNLYVSGVEVERTNNDLWNLGRPPAEASFFNGK